jgi:hypothetical protein
MQAIIGSAVRHNASGETGVVVAATRNRLWVQTVPCVTVIWYRASVTEI